MVRLYNKTLVRQHLEYCVSAWSPHYIKDKKLLERVQHRFTRMIKEVRGKDYLDKLLLLQHVNFPTRARGTDTPHLLDLVITCLLYTSPSPRDRQKSRMPSSA